MYANASDLWRLALPPDSLFQEQGIEPGEIGDVVHAAGAGLGSLLVDDASSPRDAWTVRVLCTRGGELNTPGVINPGLVPQVRVQLLDPVSSAVLATSRILTPDEGGRVRVQRGGFTLLLANATSGTPVTLGAGNASLIFTPRLAAASVQVLVGSALGYAFRDGALTLTVMNTTTAAQAAAYLTGLAEVVAYLQVVAGGDGSGVVQAAARTAVPLASFTSSERWTFSTLPSPDIVAALQVASDLLDSFLRGTYTLPLLSWGDDLRLVVCQLARWQLLVRRGLDKQQDFQVYDPQGLGCYGWARSVQQGNLRISVQETPPGVSFPLLVPPIDPLSEEAGSFPI